MKHKLGFKRLGRNYAHRQSLHRNMVMALIKYERIKTTITKAKEIRKTAEKLITRAKVDSVHNRRMAAKTLYSKNMVAKLFTDVAPRFNERAGGYTRILKIGQRPADATEMVFLELVDREDRIKKRRKKAENQQMPKIG
ncbi:MAG: 50S ribosomal protein L17 [Spirochaetales bacterium]|nr:50S ribosomal protein L17 [Spirochaetales bacterium]